MIYKLVLNYNLTHYLIQLLLLCMGALFETVEAVLSLRLRARADTLTAMRVRSASMFRFRVRLIKLSHQLTRSFFGIFFR
jgi:hypothetical protein